MGFFLGVKKSPFTKSFFVGFSVFAGVSGVSPAAGVGTGVGTGVTAGVGVPAAATAGLLTPVSDLRSFLILSIVFLKVLKEMPRLICSSSLKTSSLVFTDSAASRESNISRSRAAPFFFGWLAIFWSSFSASVSDIFLTFKMFFMPFWWAIVPPLSLS